MLAEVSKGNLVTSRSYSIIKTLNIRRFNIEA